MGFLNFSLPAFLLVPTTEKYEREWRQLNRLHARHQEIYKSEAFRHYEKLNDYISSPDFKEDLAQIKALKYHGSKEEMMERRVAELRKYREIKHYRKTGEAESEIVKEYLDLQEHIHTPSFKKHKAYLKDRKRHLQSDEYKQLLEYKRLANSKEIKQYFHVEKKHAELFAKLNQIETLFDDEFRNAEMSAHWSVNPLQSEHTFQHPYSQNEELQCLTPGANVEQRGGVAHIYTRQEEAKAMAWDQKLGFVPRRFSYTSGLLTTGTNFQICTGTVEIRLRFPNIKNVYHSCWLGGDQRLPFISGFTYCNKTLEMGVYNADGKSESKRKKIAFNANSFYVLSLEITARNIVWSINGKKVFECAHNLKNSLSLGFSSGVVGKTNNEKLPASFEIDWVRVFNNPIIRKLR